MPVLTKFQDFVPISDRSRVNNHAILVQGTGTTDFYFLQADPATGAIPVSVTITPEVLTTVDNIFFPYTVTPVTTAAYVTILAATSGAVVSLLVQDTSGSMLKFAIGAAGLEVDQFYVQAGGFSFQLSFTIPAGSRLSLKALDATANSGAFLATLLG
jgi:hypothetical protein